MRGLFYVTIVGYFFTEIHKFYLIVVVYSSLLDICQVIFVKSFKLEGKLSRGLFFILLENNRSINNSIFDYSLKFVTKSI